MPVKETRKLLLDRVAAVAFWPAKQLMAWTYSGTSLRDLKAVSSSADGSQIAWMFGILFNLFPQLAYIHVHGTGADESCLAPHRVKNLVTGEDMAGMLRQVMKQPELRGR